MNNIDKKILAEYEDVALSDRDIFNLLDGKFKLVLYPELINYSNIDEILGSYNACVLLFEAKKAFGHWVCLWKLDHNTVSFFNSYGGYPDDSLDYIPEHFARINNEDYPYLSVLLTESPYELTYNDKAYQKHSKNIKTCGRHCIVRLWNKNLTDEEYEKWMDDMTKKYNVDYDQFVTMCTNKI